MHRLNENDTNRQISFIYNVCRMIILCFFVIFSCIVLLYATGYYAHIGMEDGMTVIRKQSFGVIFLAVSMVGIAVFLRRILQKVSPKNMFFCCACMTMILGLWLVIFADSRINDDPFMVNNYLQFFLSGDFHGIQKGYYFSYAPGNLGLLTYEIPFYLINKSTRLLFFMNLVWVLLSEYSMWKIIEEQFPQNKLIQNYLIILQTAFLPMLFHIMRVYGQIPGAGFISLALLVCSRLYRKQSKLRVLLFGIVAVLLMGLACMVRANYSIAAIAILIVGFLLMLKNKQIGVFALSAAMFVGAIGIPMVERQTYRILGNENFDTGVPFSAYLCMGLSPHPEYREKDGWFSGYNWDTYAAQDFDTVRADKVARRDLANLLEYYKEKNPFLLLEVLEHKIITTWSDPTYESISIGPAEYTNGKNNETLLLDSLYGGDYAYIGYELFMRVVVYAIYFCWLIGGLILLFSKEDKTGDVFDSFSFGILFFLGTIIFHLFWETMASYVYVSVFWMLPFVAWTLCEIDQYVQMCWTKFKKINKKLDNQL